MKEKMAEMRFEQLQRFVLAKKIFWGWGTLNNYPNAIQISSIILQNCPTVKWGKLKVSLLFVYKIKSENLKTT